MDENELLQQLRQVAREEAGSEPPLDERWDERWDRLAAGTLSAGEEAELRRLAEGSEEARMAYEAFRPLGAEFHARVMEAIARSNEGPFRRTVRWLATAGGGAARAAAATLWPSPSPMRRLAAWGTAATATASTLAALLLWPPLPVYTLARLSGGASIIRGEGAEVAALAPGDRFQAILSPDTAVKRVWPLRTRAFLLRGAEVRRVAVAPEIAPSGAVRVTGTLDRDLPAGTWTLWLVVGKWGTLPDPADLQAISAAGPVHRRHWVAMPKTLPIQPRAPD